MDWTVFSYGPALPQFGAILGMLVLSVVVFRLGFLTPAHRAFALLLVLRAASMLAATLSGMHTNRFIAPDPEEAHFWARMMPWFVIPIPFVIVRFVSVYPRRRGFFGRHPAAVPLLVTGAVLGELAYLLDHGLWLRSTVNADGVVLWLNEGPLAVFLSLMYVGWGLLALVFARDFVTMPSGPRRTAVFLVAVAFAANSVYDSVGIGIYVLAGLYSVSALPFQLMSALALVPAGAAVFVLARHAFGAEPGLARPSMMKGLALPAAAALLAGVPVLLNLLIDDPPNLSAFSPYLLLLGAWRLLLPGLVTYALVKFQLFDIDLRIKRTLRGSLIGAVGFGAFTLVSELLENQITPSLPDLAGLAIAVALAFTLSPLQKAASGIANRVMPNTHETPEYMDRKRLDVYRATLEGAYEDGAITDRERRLLANLRVQLGLDPDVASALEQDIRSGFGAATPAGAT